MGLWLLRPRDLVSLHSPDSLAFPWSSETSCYWMEVGTSPTVVCFGSRPGEDASVFVCIRSQGSVCLLSLAGHFVPLRSNRTDARALQAMEMPIPAMSLLLFVVPRCESRKLVRSIVHLEKRMESAFVRS